MFYEDEFVNFTEKDTVLSITRNRGFGFLKFFRVFFHLRVRQRGVKTIPLISMSIYPNSFLDFFSVDNIFLTTINLKDNPKTFEQIEQIITQENT